MMTSSVKLLESPKELSESINPSTLHPHYRENSNLI